MDSDERRGLARFEFQKAWDFRFRFIRQVSGVRDGGAPGSGRGWMINQGLE